MISVRDLTRRYESRRPGARAVEALRDVSFDVPTGAVWSIVGPNGAGKTTLFSLLLGFLRPTSGTVLLDELPPRRFARAHGIGYLPERFDLPAAWTVRQALRAFARLDGLDGSAAARAADAALDRFDLVSHRNRLIRELSRGLLQRVGLAQTSLVPRRLVVLDEPTQGLDPLWRIKLREWVAELGSNGATVLVASHELDEVERMSEYAILLDAGKLREIVDVRAPADPLGYRLETDASAHLVTSIFPGADQSGAAGMIIVEADGAADLSRRLAALLAAGATVSAVVPLSDKLEARVRRTLGDAPDRKGSGE